MTGPISGKGIHGKIGGNLVAGIHDVDISHDGDNLDATTADDEGGLRDDTGCSRLTVRIKGYFSLTNGTVQGIKRGTTVTNLNIYLSLDESAAGKKVFVGEGLVQSGRITGTVRDRVFFEATIVSQGNNYSLP